MMTFQEFKNTTMKPRVLTPAEMRPISDAASFYIYDPTVSLELFRMWHKFFVENSFDLTIITQLFDTFWKWYVITAFKNFDSHTSEELLDILPYQTVMAYRLGYGDLQYWYIDYHMMHIPEDQDQRTLHRAISERVLAMSIPFDYRRGIPLNELIRKMQQRDQLDQIEYSSIMGDLENFLFPYDDDETQTTEQKQEHIIKLIDFLLFLVDPKSIDEAREAYTKYAPHLSTSVFSDLTFAPDEEDEESQESTPVAEKKVSFTSIRDSVVREAKNQSLNPETDDYMAFVFEQLQKISDEMGDPRILDLYYFDEQAGRFVWNDELLNSSEQESQ